MTTEPEDAAMQIARKLIADAIAQGYSVSVKDDYEGDGDVVISMSDDPAAIEAVLRTTEGDLFIFRDADGHKVGWASIIWSNGHDNPSNSSCGDTIDAICAGAMALAEQLSEAD